MNAVSFTNAELSRCALREAALRRNVYRRRGMTPEREKEIAMMEAIAEHFRDLADADLQTRLASLPDVDQAGEALL